MSQNPILFGFQDDSSIWIIIGVVLVLLFFVVAIVVIGLVIFFVQKRRHPGSEPSPYVPGREWTGKGTVQSEETGDFVDVSEPPTDEVPAGTATSTYASK